MRRYQQKSKTKDLFKLMGELDECKEDMEYHAIIKKSNRLDYIEKNAYKIEQIAIAMQKKYRKCVESLLIKMMLLAVKLNKEGKSYCGIN